MFARILILSLLPAANGLAAPLKFEGIEALRLMNEMTEIQSNVISDTEISTVIQKVGEDLICEATRWKARKAHENPGYQANCVGRFGVEMKSTAHGRVFLKTNKQILIGTLRFEEGHLPRQPNRKHAVIVLAENCGKLGGPGDSIKVVDQSHHFEGIWEELEGKPVRAIGEIEAVSSEHFRVRVFDIKELD